MLNLHNLFWPKCYVGLSSGNLSILCFYLPYSTFHHHCLWNLYDFEFGWQRDWIKTFTKILFGDHNLPGCARGTEEMGNATSLLLPKNSQCYGTNTQSHAPSSGIRGGCSPSQGDALEQGSLPLFHTVIFRVWSISEHFSTYLSCLTRCRVFF